jgi:hypothetical protein
VPERPSGSFLPVIEQPRGNSSNSTFGNADTNPRIIS